MRVVARNAARVAVAAIALACLGPAQQRSPLFATVVGPENSPIAGAEVTCVFTPEVARSGDADVVRATTDERGRARCELLVGRVYVAWAVGPADDHGTSLVCDPIPFVAAGRVLQLQASEPVTARTVAVAGLAAWRELGAAGLRWFPDASQDTYVDLPLPAGDEATIPPSPWTTGVLGLRDAGGELMVASQLAPGTGQETIALAAPIAVHAVVRNMVGEKLAGVRLEHATFTSRGWGMFHWPGAPDRYRVAGVTDAEGTVDLHVPAGPSGAGPTLHACKSGYASRHREVEGAGTLDFALAPLEPTELTVAGTDATVTLAARTGFSVRKNDGVRFDQRRLEVTALGGNRWLVHREADSFIPALFVEGKVPGAATWDWVGDQAPSRIDLAALGEREVEVTGPDGSPAPAVLAVVRGQGGVPARWEILVATDLAGRARLWLPKLEYLVYATTGTAHAWTILDGEHAGPLQLRLEEMPTMRIRVRDADGPVRGATAALASVEHGGNEPPKMVAPYLSLGYARYWPRSDADGLLVARVFEVRGMRFTLEVRHGERKSDSFRFAAGSEAEVTLER